MGLAHFSAGRPDRAIELARQALAERPGLTWPYRDLATYYVAAGKMEQARDALEKFVLSAPGNDCRHVCATASASWSRRCSTAMSAASSRPGST